MNGFHAALVALLHAGRFCCLAAALALFNMQGLAAGSDQNHISASITSSLRDAQVRQDEPAIHTIVSQAIHELGARAGEPDVKERYVQPPAGTLPLSATEAAQAFDPYYRHIVKHKWWRIGEDPRQSTHPLRDAASVIVGCVYAHRGNCQQPEKLLSLANEAAEYLLWAQQQAGRGLFPFPANRNGTGKAFDAARRFLQEAERQHKLTRVESNRWIVDDLGDGGLQFDNGVCGAALLELFLVTKDERLLDAAKQAGEWAIRQPVVPNWNYNSFSVYLLAELARTTGESKWRDAAVKKARLGIYPGQLTAGANKGRWFDPHNAQLAYHYILVRSLVSLAACLDRDSAEFRQAVAALAPALQSRNKEFTTLGVANVESAFEALLLLDQYFPRSERDIGDVQQAEALRTLELYCLAKFRAKQPPVAPGPWGRYLFRLRTADK